MMGVWEIGGTHPRNTLHVDGYRTKRLGEKGVEIIPVNHYRKRQRVNHSRSYGTNEAQRPCFGVDAAQSTTQGTTIQAMMNGCEAGGRGTCLIRDAFHKQQFIPIRIGMYNGRPPHDEWVPAILIPVNLDGQSADIQR